MRFIFLLCSLASAVMAIAQPDVRSDVAVLSSDELNQKLDDSARDSRGPDIRQRLVEAAVASKRPDLIKTCFGNPRTTSDTIKAIVQLPEGELKQRLTIMMLRTPSGMVWPEENPSSMATRITPSVMREPFISVIPQLLPTVKLNENWLKYQVGRTRLADDMEAALNAKESKSATPPVPTKAQPATAQVQPAAPAKPFLNTAPSPQPEAEPVHRHLWWLTAGALVLIVLAWKVLKKRS